MSCEPCTTTTVIPQTALVCPPATPCPATACVPSSYVCGDYTYTTNADCTQTRVRTSTNLANGTYTNPTITVVNGCMTAIASGSRVLQSRPEPCSTTGATTTPVATPVTISALPCNLASLDGGGAVYAGLTLNQAGQSIQATGCGSPTSPLVLSFAASTGVMTVASTTLGVTTVGGAITVNAVGVTNSTCGNVIENGLIKTWVPPIVSVTGSNGAKVTTTACAAAVEFDESTALVNNKSFIGLVTNTSSAGSYRDPETAVTGTFKAGHAIVYGTRVFIDTPVTANVYNSSGTLIAIAPGFTTYADHNAALLALAAVYTWTGQ